MKNDSTDPLLQEIRERREYASTEWKDVLDEAKKDRLCVAGKPWEALDPAGYKERRDANRPRLALDELGQYINQVVNDVRANPRGIKFAPTGNGANDKGAEFYQNHMREIEYRSHARVAYSTAFDNAATSSIGWLRVCTKREHIRTFNKDLYIEPVVNPDQVLPDPNFTWPDARDVKYLFYIEPWTVADFKRKFKKAKVVDFSGGIKSLAGPWLRKDMLDVAEYWRLDTFMRKLVAYRMPGSKEILQALIDELPDGKLPDGVDNLRQADVEDSRVECHITNGVEVLEEQKWLGKYIPFVACTGKTLYVDKGAGARREILSLTRLARDPYMLHCYIATCKAEAIGGVPRSQWVGYKGQFAKPERWQAANHEPIAFLEAEVVVEGSDQVLPLPQRQSWDPPIQNLEISQESARRSIQAAMGISPLPTGAQRRNEKSGKALQQIEASGQRGSFHFVDHYDLMIERTGVINEDLMDKTLDTARKVPVRDNLDSSSIVSINDPNDPESIFTKGDYRVTVSTGPANESQRDAADQFVDAMVSNVQVIAGLVGPQKAATLLGKSVKLKQLGPIGDEIAELLAPPEPIGQDGKPIPPEMQAMQGQLQQMQQQLQQAGEVIKSDIHKEQAKTEGAKELKTMDISWEREKLTRELAAKVEVARISAAKEAADARAEAAEERLALGIEVHEAAKDRIHDVNLAAAAHASAAAQSEQQHDHALEQGQQGVQGQLAVQAAAPQPEPAGAGA